MPLKVLPKACEPFISLKMIRPIKTRAAQNENLNLMEEKLNPPLLNDEKSLKIRPPRDARFGILFSHYRLKVFISDRKYGYLGRGSRGFLPQLVYYAGVLDQDINPLFDVGNFCEFAESEIIIGGEHHNGRVCNNSFDAFTLFNHMIINKRNETFKSYAKGPVKIGHNVIIGRKATILSGTEIGTGAIIGASSVIAKDIPPFAIVGGNPARIIKYRFDEEMISRIMDSRWWDLEPEFIVRNLELFAQNNIPDHISPRDVELPYLEDSKSICISVNIKPKQRNPSFDLKVIGAEIDGDFIPLPNLPDDFRYYVSQSNLPDRSEIIYITNIFKHCGL